MKEEWKDGMEAKGKCTGKSKKEERVESSVLNTEY